MSIKRETYYAELAGRLKAVKSIKTHSRRLQHLADVPPAKQPACFVTVGNQQPSYNTGRTPIWSLSSDVYLYVRDPKGSDPGPLLNALLDDVMEVFKPDNGNVNACTFGGMCHKVEVQNIETDEGTLGEQAVAVLTVTMTVVGTPI